MRQRREFASDKQFWSYYNKIRKAEIDAGIIKPKESKSKKDKENDKNSDEEAPKKRGRKKKKQDSDHEDDQYVMTTLIQDLMVSIF